MAQLSPSLFSDHSHPPPFYRWVGGAHITIMASNHTHDEICWEFIKYINFHISLLIFVLSSYIRQVCSTLATPQSPRWSWGCCCRAAAAPTCMCLLIMIMQGRARFCMVLTAHNLAFHLQGGLGHDDSVLPLLLHLHHCLLATEHVLLDVTSCSNL